MLFVALSHQFIFTIFLRVLKGYSTLREGIRVLRGERESLFPLWLGILNDFGGFVHKSILRHDELQLSRIEQRVMA